MNIYWTVENIEPSIINLLFTKFDRECTGRIWTLCLKGPYCARVLTVYSYLSYLSDTTSTDLKLVFGSKANGARADWEISMCLLGLHCSCCHYDSVDYYFLSTNKQVSVLERTFTELFAPPGPGCSKAG